MKWLCVSLCLLLCCCKSKETIVQTDAQTQVMKISDIQRSGIITITPFVPGSFGDSVGKIVAHGAPSPHYPRYPQYIIQYTDTVRAVHSTQATTTAKQSTTKQPISHFTNNLLGLFLVIVTVLIVLALLRMAFR